MTLLSKSQKETKGLYSFNTNQNKRTIILCSEKGEAEVHKINMEDTEKSELFSFNVQGPVNTMKVLQHNSKLEMAIGGKQNFLKIYDVEYGKEVHKFRNLPHDFLDMPNPEYITGNF
jgi:hypothetical protein